MAGKWTVVKTVSQKSGIEPNRTVNRRARNRLVQAHRSEFEQYLSEERMAQGMGWSPPK